MKKKPSLEQAAANAALAELACSLSTHADHFRDLAKEIALDLLQKPYAPDVEKKKFNAQQHLVRSEIYRTCSNIAVGRQSK
jgi:hypothetical protein